ncbi:cytochrome P450 [Rhizoctonia solani]|uniref:Cytochrome P450 n=1 Tax=Rhizoctonia solani TaxID=456999 RepID=A0A8H7M207_9AGAM|nr:cytochrome P450 [Rhizoctonia solani]KAF8755929.1 cytochrome P450 [Rhizoctonia solani]
MPTQYEEEVYKEWSDQVGSDIISLKVPGQSIIVLNSADHANELLNKRSSIYSDRPYIHMIASPKLTGWGKGAAVSRYNEHWKAQRRYMHDALGKKSVKMFWPLIERDVRFTARKFLDNSSPDDIVSEICRMTGCSILSAVYGYDTTSTEDPLVKIVQVALNGFIQAAAPANFLVNYFPFLEIIPSWHLEQPTRPLLTRSWPIYAAKLPIHGFVTPLEEQEDPLKWAVGSLFGVGLVDSCDPSPDTSPRDPGKARQELDGVLEGAPPTLQDRDSLPYMCNIIRKLCVEVGSSDSYSTFMHSRGYIPWAISNNPQVYPEPSRFNPDRFLDPAVPDAPAFGFGRRICPGVHFAEATIFMAISTLLAVFDIQPGRDENGNPVIPDARMGPSSLVR